METFAQQKCLSLLLWWIFSVKAKRKMDFLIEGEDLEIAMFADGTVLIVSSPQTVEPTR